MPSKLALLKPLHSTDVWSSGFRLPLHLSLLDQSCPLMEVGLLSRFVIRGSQASVVQFPCIGHSFTVLVPLLCAYDFTAKE